LKIYIRKPSNYPPMGSVARLCCSAVTLLFSVTVWCSCRFHSQPLTKDLLGVWIGIDSVHDASAIEGLIYKKCRALTRLLSSCVYNDKLPFAHTDGACIMTWLLLTNAGGGAAPSKVVAPDGRCAMW